MGKLLVCNETANKHAEIDKPKLPRHDELRPLQLFEPTEEAQTKIKQLDLLKMPSRDTYVPSFSEQIGGIFS